MAGADGRSATQFSAMDLVPEMKFTGKERDAESGLDFFGARYMSSAQGRFTSPDPIHIMPQKLLDPQQWNMYSYVRNNPLRLVDPTGMYTTDCAQDDKKCNKLIGEFEKARQIDLRSRNENVRNGANAYGGRGDDNGVVVHVLTGQQMQQAIGVIANGAVVPTPGPLPGQGDERLDVYINKDLGGKDLQRTVAHEGTHVGDDLPFINSFNPDTGMYNGALNITHGQTEFNAFTAGAAVKRYEYTNVQCGNGPCISGPQDAAKINQFLHNSPTYGPAFNIPIFDPRRWPQQ
jgi:RHS repeat-associated protein